MCAHESPPFRCELHILRHEQSQRDARHLALDSGLAVIWRQQRSAKARRVETRRRVEFKALDETCGVVRKEKEAQAMEANRDQPARPAVSAAARSW